MDERARTSGTTADQSEPQYRRHHTNSFSIGLYNWFNQGHNIYVCSVRELKRVSHHNMIKMSLLRARIG